MTDESMSGTSWHSYPKVWGLGHPEVAELFTAGPVLVEEKVDGSQFSFGAFGPILRARSKGKELVLDAPEKMFEAAVKSVQELAPILHDGWTYRGEYLMSPHHNGLSYDRVPVRNIILFDINTGPETYLTRAEKQAEAERLGLEIVPLVYEGEIKTPEEMKTHLERVSILGGCKIEGLVFKQYKRFGHDGKCLMGKYVREDFKEVQSGAWKEANPKTGDIVQALAEKVRTPARWEKAAQHLRERGELTESVKDIGNLMKEAQKDIDAECAEQIKEALYEHAKKQILRTAVAGLPEWWKKRLLDKQFSGTH
jgi:hypothetical protein